MALQRATRRRGPVWNVPHVAARGDGLAGSLPERPADRGGARRAGRRGQRSFPRPARGDPAALAAYPFTPEAFELFVEHTTAGEMANKPSEVLGRLQKGANKAISAGKKLIDEAIVESISSEGWQ